MVVTNEPILNQINEQFFNNNLDKKCATVTQITTPNRINVQCNYPLEGRFLTIISNKTEESSILTLNEIQPLLLGSPLAFASSFVHYEGVKYEPQNVLIDSEGAFKSLDEEFPWIAIDFQEPRIVESVNLTFNGLLSNVEIRVGYERITSFGRPLNDRNRLCGVIVNSTDDIQVKCNETLNGRFLTLQKMGYGALELSRVLPLPLPSKKV